MSSTVCGDCWALYDDVGKCECEEPALRRIDLPYCERSCEANAFKIEIRRLEAALKAAVAAEREACADICDQHASVEGIAQRCAEQIRKRGEV